MRTIIILVCGVFMVFAKDAHGLNVDEDKLRDEMRRILPAEAKCKNMTSSLYLIGPACAYERGTVSISFFTTRVQSEMLQITLTYPEAQDQTSSDFGELRKMSNTLLQWFGFDIAQRRMCIIGAERTFRELEARGQTVADPIMPGALDLRRMHEGKVKHFKLFCGLSVKDGKRTEHFFIGDNDEF